MKTFALLLTLFFGFSAISQGKPLRIAVASNFLPTLEKLKTAYLEVETSQEIELIAGSTGKLYLQITKGAPYDLFFAADSERPELLEKNHFLQANGRFAYAHGVLALWTTGDSLNSQNGEKRLQENRFDKLAIANPKVAPFGAASIEMLETYSLYESLVSKLVFGENVSQTYHYAKTGAAEFALVSYSSIVSDQTQLGSFWLPPHSSYPPIIQEVALISQTENAKSFFEFIRSPNAQSIIEEAGYQLP